MATAPRPPSQRMLKVGEEVRHALADMFIRGEVHAPEFEGISITVSEVRMTPDLRVATAFVATLGTDDVADILPLLNKRYDKAIRKVLAGKVHLKFSPTVRFKQDESFDVAHRIHDLVNKAVASDRVDDRASDARTES